MGVVALRKLGQYGFVLRTPALDLALGQRVQAGPCFPPVGFHADMVALQLAYQGHHIRGSALQQQGKDMAFFVLMVQGGCNVKVTQDIACSLAGRFVTRMGVQVVGQALQQVQRALHALVAGFEHFKRRIKPYGGSAEAGQGHCAGHGG